MAKESVRLGRLDRFARLSDRQVAKIADAGTYVTVPPDWALLGQGQSADKAYLLISGEVSVRQNGKEVAQLGAGDVFGEMGIVAHKLRNATVVSMTPLECLHFTREQVEKLEKDIPEFGEALRASAEERKQSGAAPT